METYEILEGLDRYLSNKLATARRRYDRQSKLRAPSQEAAIALDRLDYLRDALRYVIHDPKLRTPR